MSRVHFLNRDEVSSVASLETAKSLQGLAMQRTYLKLKSNCVSCATQALGQRFGRRRRKLVGEFTAALRFGFHYGERLLLVVAFV